MGRTRSKSGVISYSGSDTNWDTVLSFPASEIMNETFYPGSTPVDHHKYIGGKASWRQPSNGVNSQKISGNFHPGYLGCGNADYESTVQDQLYRLNWRKLDSSNQASLIQTLAELDESLLLFTKRFWTQLNYGAFTWGVVPFVQDVCNWATSIKRAFNTISAGPHAYRFHDKYTIPVNTGYVPGVAGISVKATGEVVVSRKGHYNLSSFNESLSWLDRLGFHPDIATAYDLVPFSFVLDYFLPIGKFLTDTFQRGWVNSIYFTGWVSRKDSINFEFAPSPGSYWTSVEGNCKYEHFSRTPEASLLHTEPIKFDLPEFSIPTLQQIFNVQYLAFTNQGGSMIRKPKKVYTTSLRKGAS